MSDINVNKRKEYQKLWYINNKEKSQAYRKTWYINNKEKAQACRKTWELNNPDYQKHYRLNNINKFKEYAKKNYNKNKQKIVEKRKIRYQLTKYKISNRFKNLKHAAKRRKIEFCLTLDQFKELTNLNCYYCNNEIKSTIAGLDRINNNKGYSIDNVLPCCKECNYIRGYKLTVEETKVVITALLNYRKIL